MTHSKILVHRWGPGARDFSTVLQTDLTRGLVSSVAQGTMTMWFVLSLLSGYTPLLQLSHFNKGIIIIIIIIPLSGFVGLSKLELVIEVSDLDR